MSNSWLRPYYLSIVIPETIINEPMAASLSKTDICWQVTNLEGKSKTNESISNKDQKGSIPIF